MKSKHLIVLAVVWTAGLTLTGADMLLTSAVRVEQGGQKQESKEIVWIGKGKMRRDAEGTTQLILAEQKKAYFVDHSNKTYSVLSLPIDLAKVIPPEAKAMMDQAAAALKFDIKVTPSDERKKIRDWDARKYSVTMANAMMKMDLTVWATKDIKLDYAGYNAMFENAQAMFPGGAEMTRELAKIEGMKVLSETSMPAAGYTQVDELISAEEKTPPGGTYDVPAGYKETEYNPFLKMQ